jgi:hypothetical protein
VLFAFSVAGSLEELFWGRADSGKRERVSVRGFAVLEERLTVECVGGAVGVQTEGMGNASGERGSVQ